MLLLFFPSYVGSFGKVCLDLRACARYSVFVNVFFYGGDAISQFLAENIDKSVFLRDQWHDSVADTVRKVSVLLIICGEEVTE